MILSVRDSVFLNVFMEYNYQNSRIEVIYNNIDPGLMRGSTKMLLNPNTMKSTTKSYIWEKESLSHRKKS